MGSLSTWTPPLFRQSEKVFSTDPPYYDNIGYADLSDFFYVWLRRSVSRSVLYPELFSTLLGSERSRN